MKNSLDRYNELSKEDNAWLEHYIIYRDIYDIATDHNTTISDEEVESLKEIILDFYNEDSKKNFPLSSSTRFITSHYLEKNITLSDLKESSFHDIYYAIDDDDISMLKENFDEERNSDFKQENGFLCQYNKQEISELLKKKEKLVYIDTGMDEIVARFKDLPDIIIDIAGRFTHIRHLKVYDFDNPNLENPILTTIDGYLDKCDGNVRKDIIDRLVGLQLGKLEVKDYKVIDENKLDEVINSIENNFEKER